MELHPPDGYAEVVKLYGDPRGYVRPDGTMRPEWERHTLSAGDFPAPIALDWDREIKVTRFRSHQLLVKLFEAAFRGIHEAGLWGELRTFGGIYAPRRQRGGARPSLHLWGAAVDLNPSEDPQGDHDIDMCPGVVQIFEGMGFVWGGRWAGSRTDAMHFQYARNY